MSRFGYIHDQETANINRDFSRLSEAGYGPTERMPLAHTQGRRHERHVSIIDPMPSSSLSSFQFHGLNNDPTFSDSSPAAPPGFKPLAPWPMISQAHSSTILHPIPSAATGGPIKDAGLLKDTALNHHELINPGSLQPLTLQSLLGLASPPPTTTLGSSVEGIATSVSAPLNVGGSQRRGSLYSSSISKAKTPLSAALGNDASSLFLNEDSTTLDSLEQAFLVSKDTPPHEQLLGPKSALSDGKAGGGVGGEMRSLLSNLPRHLTVHIPQQEQPTTIAILQAAGQNRSSQTTYNDMVTVSTTQPIAAQRKAGSSQKGMRESYKAIQEMKINKVKMPPLASQAPAPKRASASIEEDLPMLKETIMGFESQQLESPVLPSEPRELMIDKPTTSSTSRFSPEVIGSLSQSLSKLNTDSSAWIGGLIPAATIGDCPLEVGSFRWALSKIKALVLNPTPLGNLSEVILVSSILISIHHIPPPL